MNVEHPGPHLIHDRFVRSTSLLSFCARLVGFIGLTLMNDRLELQHTFGMVVSSRKTDTVHSCGGALLGESLSACYPLQHPSEGLSCALKSCLHGFDGGKLALPFSDDLTPNCSTFFSRQKLHSVSGLTSNPLRLLGSSCSTVREGD